MENDSDVTVDSSSTSEEVQPNGSEAVTNTGSTTEQTVPYSRFQEVNDNLKEERTKREELSQQFESFQSKFTPKSDDNVEIDPETQKILDHYAKQNGFVSKAELEKVQNEAAVKIQVQTDIQELKGQFKDFDYSKVADYAKENGMSLNSKADLRAVYRDMNTDSIIDNAKKQAIADFQKSGRTTGETGSTSTQQAQTQSAPTTKSRIAAAREKFGI
jgi:NADH pyrophosphatase NudC (nudix superfamily)